jgi:hypothetical protein
MNKRVSVMLKLDPDLSAELRRASGASGRSFDDLVEEAVREWLASHSEEASSSEVERAYKEIMARYSGVSRRLAK